MVHSKKDLLLSPSVEALSSSTFLDTLQRCLLADWQNRYEQYPRYLDETQAFDETLHDMTMEKYSSRFYHCFGEEDLN
ncbi:unnamed protein product, partial [Symbiodinium necroappetens]